MTTPFGSNALLSTLDKALPRFEIQSQNVQILQSPRDYQDALLQGVSTARRRIFLSSLYIGTDVPQLVDALGTSLRAQPILRLYLLLDMLRGTRPGPEANDGSTTATILLPLLDEFGHQRVVICFYHTPNLRGIWKSVAPRRLDEGFGLQHIKLCGFDDRVIVTGANLSSEYFENRQDRYYLFDSAELTDYFHDFLVTLGGFAYQMKSGTSLEQVGRLPIFEWPTINFTPRPLEKSDHQTIVSAARQHLLPLIWRQNKNQKPIACGLGGSVTSLHGRDPADTVVYPLTQLAPMLGLSACDLFTPPGSWSSNAWALTRLLHLLPHCLSWTLSTPYLSPSPLIKQWLERLSSATYRGLPENTKSPCGAIITADPEAMSFYGARGLAGYIPHAFLNEVHKLQTSLGIPQVGLIAPRLLQWRRGTAHQQNGWTFHAKGWWIRGLSTGSEQDEGATITLIGSSNYGERSLKLDLELDVLLVTTNPDLKRRIHEEEDMILAYGHSVQDTGTTSGLLDATIVWAIMFLIRLLGLGI